VPTRASVIALPGAGKSFEASAAPISLPRIRTRTLRSCWTACSRAARRSTSGSSCMARSMAASPLRASMYCSISPSRFGMVTSLLDSARTAPRGRSGSASVGRSRRSST